MIMIIGGAWQGKTAFAETLTGISQEQWTDGRSCGENEIYSCKGIRNFHEYVRNALREKWEKSNV